MFCLSNADLILVVSALILIFSMQPIRASKKAIMELEERVIEAERELYEVLAYMSETELAFREGKGWIIYLVAYFMWP